MKNFDQVKRILHDAAIRLWLYREPLYKALAVPLFALAILAFLSEGRLSASKTVAYGAIQLLAYTLLAINTHRIMLMGPGSVPKWGLIRPTQREARFVLRMISLGLIMLLIGLIALIPTIGIWLMGIVSIYVLARFSLVFPAIATDNPWSLGEAWDAALGHQIMVIVVVGLLPASIGAGRILLAGLPYSKGLMIVVSSFTTIYTVAALSLVYERIHSVEE